MRDDFIGTFGQFETYKNMHTEGEQYPDVPFTVQTTSTISIAALTSAANQAFSGTPSNG